MKILKYIVIAMILLGCQSSPQTNIYNETLYQEFTNIYDTTEMKSKNNQLYFEHVFVAHIDSKQNRLLVTLKNSKNKRCSVFIQFQELPKNIDDYHHQYINVVTESVVFQSYIPVLKGIQTYEILKK